MRHNEIRDTTAKLLSEVCHNVAIEPPLQPLSGETFTHTSANVSAEAHLDIKAQGFWNHTQDAYFDVMHLGSVYNIYGTLYYRLVFHVSTCIP